MWLRKAGAPEVRAGRRGNAVDEVIDFEKSIEAPAPGAATMPAARRSCMELARVMSQYKFEKTIVFIAFAARRTRAHRQHALCG